MKQYIIWINIEFIKNIIIYFNVPIEFSNAIASFIQLKNAKIIFINDVVIKTFVTNLHNWNLYIVKRGMFERKKEIYEIKRFKIYNIIVEDIINFTNRGIEFHHIFIFVGKSIWELLGLLLLLIEWIIGGFIFLLFT